MSLEGDLQLEANTDPVNQGITSLWSATPHKRRHGASVPGSTLATTPCLSAPRTVTPLFFLHGKGEHVSSCTPMWSMTHLRFLSATHTVCATLLLPRTDSSPEVQAMFGGAGQSQQPGKSKETIHRLKASEVSSPLQPLFLFQGEGGEEPSESTVAPGVHSALLRSARCPLTCTTAECR